MSNRREGIISCKKVKESLLKWVEANTFCWKIKENFFEVIVPVFTEEGHPVSVFIEFDKYGNFVKIHDGGYVAVSLATYFNFSKLEDFLNSSEYKRRFLLILERRVKGLKVSNNEVFLNVPLSDIESNEFKIGARAFLVAYAISELLKIHKIFLKIKTERFKTLFKSALESLKESEVLTYRETEKKGRKLPKHKITVIEPLRRDSVSLLTKLVSETDDKTVKSILFDWEDIELKTNEFKLTVVDIDEVQMESFKEKRKALGESSHFYIEVREDKKEIEEKLVSLIEEL